MFIVKKLINKCAHLIRIGENLSKRTSNGTSISVWTRIQKSIIQILFVMVAIAAYLPQIISGVSFIICINSVFTTFLSLYCFTIFQTLFHIFKCNKTSKRVKNPFSGVGLENTIKGVPIIMCFLLNPIEWLSGWVRPLSMSARISINLICGHLLVGLCLGMFIQINSMLIVNSLFISISNFYIALVETFIPLIQTFILFTLYTQWVLEIK